MTLKWCSRWCSGLLEHHLRDSNPESNPTWKIRTTRADSLPFAPALPNSGGLPTNYGGCPKDAESWLDGACPIVASYGGKDRSPMGASAGERLERVLTALGVEHDIKTYPGVGHGFMNDHDPQDQTLMLILLAKVSGTRYDPRATADARERILAMFDRWSR